MNLCRQTNGLSQLQRGQFLNDEISTGQRDQESCHRRGDGAERDIKENIEPDEAIAQVMEVVHHGKITGDESRSPKASMTRSVRADRLPLTRMRSPGSAISPNNSAASLVDITAVVFSRPPACAARAISSPRSPMVMS